jgi:hypothetical protein
MLNNNKRCYILFLVDSLNHCHCCDPPSQTWQLLLQDIEVPPDCVKFLAKCIVPRFADFEIHPEGLCQFLPFFDLPSV